MAVDSLGLPLALHVTGAHVQDSQTLAAGRLLMKLRQSNRCSRLIHVFADGNYRGTADLWARQMGFVLTRIGKIAGRFEPLPKRWVIERTFAWLMNCRRLLFDLEFKLINSEGMLWLATLRLLMRRAWPGTS